MCSLPQGWEVKKLGEVCQFFNGKAHEKHIVPNGNFVVVNSKFISTDGSIRKFIAQQMSPLFRGDIAMVMSDVPNGKALAKCYIVNEDDKYSLNQRICAIRTTEFSILFLYYQLNRHPYLLAFNNGENQTNLRKNDILNCPLCKPPLPEQKRIVAILEKAFTAIDQAKANTEKNLKNARELFQSKLQETFANGKLKIDTGEWEEKKLGELGQLTSSKRIYKREYVENGVPFYRSKEIKELGNKKEISLELFITNERYLEIKVRFGVPKKDDILLTAVGTIGEMYIVKKDERFYFKDGNIIWLKNFSILNSFYLKFALTNFVEKLKSISRGAAYSALTIEKLKEYYIPVPPLPEQKQIVKNLDAVSTETKKLETIYQRKITCLDELKKSILQKAFNGEL